jgi:hypothetical protein
VSALSADPVFEPAGDVHTVPGLLRALRVESASVPEQRVAIRRVAALATVRPFVDRLLPELRRRRLI